MANPLAAGLTQHYLTVQALTPVANQTTHGPVVTQASFNLVSLALPAAIVFISVIIIGTLIIFILKAKKAAYFMTVFILALTLGSLPPGLTLMRQPASLETKADADHVPKNLIVDQVTPNTFTVGWQTDRATVGAIRINAADQPDNLARVVSETNQDVYSHLITVTNLNPGTAYYFTVLSAGAWYQNQDQPLKVTTPLP